MLRGPTDVVRLRIDVNWGVAYNICIFVTKYWIARGWRTFLAGLCIVGTMAGCRTGLEVLPGGDASVIVINPDGSVGNVGSLPMLGRGGDGDLTIAGAGMVVNDYSGLLEDASAGTTQVEVARGARFSAGDAVLLWRTQAQMDVTRGDQQVVHMDSSGPGVFEFHVVTAIDTNTVTLSAPIEHGFPKDGSQMVRVPEYRNLTIASGASVVADPWDGSVGGIVALLVTETATVNGDVSASAMGFRGGNLDSSAGGAPSGCTGLTEPAPRAEASGESVPLGRYGSEDNLGRGNVASGGGGGACHGGGAGGGGNAGRGGNGSPSEGENFGLGGTLLDVDAFTTLVMGGGGGAGEEHHGGGTAGGRGGGVVLVRAQRVVGEGRFMADGESIDGEATVDGGSGGGAGGTVNLVAHDSLECGFAMARGGDGRPGEGVGLGGGGGGGFVAMESSVSGCEADVAPGRGGADERASAAGDGESGQVRVREPSQ